MGLAPTGDSHNACKVLKICGGFDILFLLLSKELRETVELAASNP